MILGGNMKNYQITIAVCLLYTITTCATENFSFLGKKYQLIGNIDKTDFPEPSGICFNEKRGTLFIVGDEGFLGEMKTDGTLIQKKLIKKADFEGVTCNPETGIVYIAVEGKERIIEINPDSFEIMREFDIERHFEGKLLMDKKGNGIEAITFIPNKSDPNRVTFFVANQANRLDEKDDISAIFEIEVNLNSKEKRPKGRIKNVFPMQTIDLAALQHIKKTDTLWVVSDKTNTLFEMTLTGKILNKTKILGVDQEGITVDSEGFIYIVQDSGGILKIGIQK